MAGRFAGGSAAQKLPALDPNGDMSTDEAAQALRRSPSWVKNHARELGGRIIADSWRFPIDVVERFAHSLPEARRGPKPKGSNVVVPSTPDAGRRVAAICERLELRQTVSQIVRELQETFDFVMKTREQWLAGYEADRAGVVNSCECGAPSSPSTARCDRCAPRTRTLTPAQIALLAGEELPPPGSCACSGCGTQHLTENVERLCSECQKNAVGIVVSNGRAEIALRLSSGKLLSLRALSAEEVAAVARLAAPQAPAVVSTPAVTEPDAPVDERAPALRALDAVMKQSAVGLSRLDEMLEQERKKSGKP